MTESEHEPVMPQLEISQDAQREFKQTVESLAGRKKPKRLAIKEYPVTVDGGKKMAKLIYSEEPEPDGPSARIQVRDTEEINGSFPYWEIGVYTLQDDRLVTHHTQSSLISENGVLSDPTRAITSPLKAMNVGNAVKLEERHSGEPIDEFRRAEDVLAQIKGRKLSTRIKSLPGRLTTAVHPHTSK